MPRLLLPEDRLHPAIQAAVANAHRDIVEEVQAALRSHRVVVVGMAQNPVVKTVCKVLTQAQITFTYLEYGSYFSQWRRRAALKMWTGWGTFPMVFCDGILLGGAQETQALIASGALKAKP